MSDLVGNPEDRFSHIEAHIVCLSNVLPYIKVASLIVPIIMQFLHEQITESDHSEICSKFKYHYLRST